MVFVSLLALAWPTSAAGTSAIGAMFLPRQSSTRIDAAVEAPDDTVPRRDPASAYDWPTGREVPVLRAFQPPAIRWERGHRGVDLAYPVGSQVYAAGAGRVAFAGAIGGKGVVAIEHASGLRTTYEPVQASVAAGQVVARGDPIGALLPGHCKAEECLHWGAKYGTGRAERYIDPLSLLGRLRYRLVPYDG
ncbi:hypothetical protein BSZ39_00035 [Bowdeniella nasicola]|uniref:M23ase beta-sheet core domain-containing protein n=1 Tax=Bowdeniella nasicola TaxID=208480 RepID=A0A1Q5Q6D1_9ACTO|nr:hypothetical protein BSZ39_00035 [Bowdeniella nasicola]